MRDGEVVSAHRLMTPQRGPKELVAAMVEATAKVLAEAGASLADVSAIGVGVPGAVDATAGTVANANNVPGLDRAEAGAARRDDVRGRRRRAGAARERRPRGDPRRVDARRGTAVPEPARRAGSGPASAAGSSSTASSTRAGGPPARSATWSSSPAGALCSDGRRGHLESYAGRGRMEARARRLVEEGRKTILFDLMQKKGRIRLSSGVITEALEREDDVAQASSSTRPSGRSGSRSRRSRTSWRSRRSWSAAGSATGSASRSSTGSPRR